LEIKLVEVLETEKSVLRQLIELYEYDFSEYTRADVNEYGYFGYRYFDYYWTEDARHPFFIKVDEKLAGFVLINDYCYVVKDLNASSVSEFFVMRKYRRMGVGKVAAHQVFDKYPGKWEVIQNGANQPSTIFWEEVIADYTGGKYKKTPVQTEEWVGQAIIFETPGFPT